jgi:hypothetical protein
MLHSVKGFITKAYCIKKRSKNRKVKKTGLKSEPITICLLALLSLRSPRQACIHQRHRTCSFNVAGLRTSLPPDLCVSACVMRSCRPIHVSLCLPACVFASNVNEYVFGFFLFYSQCLK